MHYRRFAYLLQQHEIRMMVMKHIKQCGNKEKEEQGPCNQAAEPFVEVVWKIHNNAIRSLEVDARFCSCTMCHQLEIGRLCM